MSTSRDNLPAVEEPKPPQPPALAEVVWAAARWVVGQEWLMRFAAVAVLLALGAAGIVYGQDAGVKLVAPVNARIDETNAELARVKAKAEEQDKRMANVERMTVETNATMKLVAMRLGVTPITLEQGKDGGQ